MMQLVVDKTELLTINGSRIIDLNSPDDIRLQGEKMIDGKINVNIISNGFT